jgi:membrane-bound inhibitor of C-type lysozyme
MSDGVANHERGQRTVGRETNSCSSEQDQDPGIGVHRRRLACLALLLTAACTGVDVQRTVYPAQFSFLCGSGGVMSVSRAPDGRSATVLVDGQSIVLRRADSAAEQKYSDGRYALYLDQERALLERDGVVVFGACRSQTPLPTAPRHPY